jgi:hypothetical protein
MSEESGHPYSELPSDENAKVWRYMDFAKFVDMLDRDALYFCRADLLGDPFEGSVPRANEDYWKTLRETHEGKDAIIQHNKAFSEWSARQSRLSTYVNCWHVNEHESAAMWKLYSREGASIAVQSKCSLLRQCLPAAVRISLVRYIDYDTQPMPPMGNVLNYCFHKRKSFEHERELRAHIWTLEHDSKTMKPIWTVQPGQPGIVVPVNLSQLIETIYVAPFCEPWIEELVGNVTRRFGLSLSIKRSKIVDQPVL